VPVPKRKRSRARRDKRFANKGMKVKAITMCHNCQDPLIPHAACKNCGFYKGVKIMATKMDRTIKRTEIRKSKEEAKAKREEAPEQNATEK
jgi:large subunit ribosomal protein L32